jgi:hypothetical protein
VDSPDAMALVAALNANTNAIKELVDIIRGKKK